MRDLNQGPGGAPLLVKVDVGCATLGISRAQLYRRMREGEIESVKVGGSRLIPYDALVAYVDRLRREAREEREASTTS